MKSMVVKSMSEIEFYRGWCKKCGICVAFCPRQVLAADEDGYPVVKDVDRCTACNLCVDRCPDFAITVFSDRKGYEKTENGDKKDDGQTVAAG